MKEMAGDRREYILWNRVLTWCRLVVYFSNDPDPSRYIYLVSWFSPAIAIAYLLLLNFVLLHALNIKFFQFFRYFFMLRLFRSYCLKFATFVRTEMKKRKMFDLFLSRIHLDGKKIEVHRKGFFFILKSMWNTMRSARERASEILVNIIYRKRPKIV